MKAYSTPVMVCMLASVLLSGCVTGGGRDAGWESLFDGKTLNGWVRRGGEASYKVKDGVIVGTTVKGTPNTFLCSERLFGDFILELEFKADPRLNSGVQIRSESHAAYRDGRVHGYQVEIDPDVERGRLWTGGIYDEGRRGWLYDLKNNEPARKAFRPNEWNHFRIEAVGDSIKTWLNGVPAADLTDSMTPIGFIALQVHGTKTDEPLEVRWRNIRIRDLDRGRVEPRTDDPYMGDWEKVRSTGMPKVAAQVIALGWGKYQVNLLEQFDTRDAPIMVMNGAETGGKVTFRSGDWWGEIDRGCFSGGRKGDEPVSFEMRKVRRISPTLGAKPPAHAIVLFDGTNFDQWQGAEGKPVGWKIVEGGAMEVVPKSGSIVTKKKFTNVRLHLEFRTPFMPEARGQKRGNSGVYLQNRYEVQVLDSYALEGLDNECGGIYKVARPFINACAPPLEWQTYDITYRAPRVGRDGTKRRNARITVVHNGVTIHENVEITLPTGSARKKGEPKGPEPLLLQDHGNPVQYRNIWLVDLAARRTTD